MSLEGFNQGTSNRGSFQSQFSNSPSMGRPGGSGEWQQLVSFHGKGKEYFFLLLRVFFFSVLTAGIHYFWGKVARRVYLWQSTSVLGTPLEYTGTGKELFFSFLIVLPIFFVFSLLASFLLSVSPFMGMVLLYGVLLYGWHFASYRTVRYRLTRTRWRGIRGNLAGGASSYALKAFGYTLAVICTLGILGPWAIRHLVSLKLNNIFWGNRRLSFDGPVRELYFMYFATFLGSLLLLGLVGGFFAYDLMAAHAAGDANPSDAVVVRFLFMYVLLVVGIVLLQSLFHAVFIRWLFRYMNFGRLEMRSIITPQALVQVRLVNIALVVFTLGIGFAWAYIREVAVVSNSIQYKGDPELESLLQDTMSAPKRGEGFLEAMDVDIAL